MMKFLFHIAMAVSATAATAMEPGPANTAAAANDEARRADAQVLIEQLSRHDDTDVAARFDERMRAALPAGKLGGVWDTLVARFGAFQRQAHAQSAERDGLIVVTIPCIFANGVLDAHVVYDAAGKVSGLRFVPGTSPLAASVGPAYSAPAYIDAGKFDDRDLAVGAFKLAATLSLPKGAGPWPAVVLVHGSGPHDRDETIGPNQPFRDLAGGLASRGIAVLRYEKRTKAHPDAFAGKAYTIDDEVTDDALAAAALLRSIPGIDAKRVFIAGHSLGAMLAPRIGARDARLAGLILLAAPATPLEDTVLRQYRYLAGLKGKPDAAALAELDRIEQQAKVIRALDPARPPAQPLMLDLPMSYWLSLRGYDPVAVAQKSTFPILVLQGERDYQVSPTVDFPHWQALCAKQPRITCTSYAQLSHLFIAGDGAPNPAEYAHAGHVDVHVIDEIARWIGTAKTGR